MLPLSLIEVIMFACRESISFLICIRVLPGLENTLGINLHAYLFSLANFSGGSRGGTGCSKKKPLEPKLFTFHGEFQEKLVKLHKANPHQLI